MEYLLAYCDRAYLDGVGVLVWRWREEANEYQFSLTEQGFITACTLRDCADELANSLPVQVVAEAGRYTNKMTADEAATAST
jgi:hypothetical protein